MKSTDEQAQREEGEEAVVRAWQVFGGGASLILLKVVKRRAQNYSFETRSFNWGKSLDRAAAGSINGSGDAAHCWSQPVRSIRRTGETFVYQPKVAVSSGLSLLFVVLCENLELTALEWDIELVRARFRLHTLSDIYITVCRNLL